MLIKAPKEKVEIAKRNTLIFGKLPLPHCECLRRVGGDVFEMQMKLQTFNLMGLFDKCSHNWQHKRPSSIICLCS